MFPPRIAVELYIRIIFDYKKITFKEADLIVKAFYRSEIICTE